MLVIKFLGGCLRVGGSAVSVESPDSNLLLDYGAYMNDHPSFPSAIPPKDLDAILLTHAHLDHSGGIPFYFSGSATPRLFATHLTLELTRILIEDMIRIAEENKGGEEEGRKERPEYKGAQGEGEEGQEYGRKKQGKEYLFFGKEELKKMISKAKRISYESINIKKCVATFLDAGHIPGSCAIHLELNGHRILYTGDFNSNPTQLLNSTQLFNSAQLKNLDCLIIESTYALEDHPPREETERRFVERINQIVENGGTVLIPAFGVARSQEILCVLYKYQFQYPIVMDGMARAVNNIFQRHLKFFRNDTPLKKALDWTKKISWGRRKEEERAQAISTPGVIIAPSGMLKGGMAINYMNELFEKPKNGILLVSFQIPDTPGRQLVDTKKWNDQEVKAQVDLFNFSSHAGRSGLWALIHEVANQNPEIPVFCMHGEEQKCRAFAKEISETTKLNAIAPKVNESFDI